MGTAKRICIVEDDDAIRESISELLQMVGYDVDVAANGQIALDHLRATDKLPNLILLDLMMPVKDGFQFCTEHAQSEKLKGIPVVVMSADGHVGQKRERTGALDYLTKPVDIDRLLNSVKKYCK